MKDVVTVGVDGTSQALAAAQWAAHEARLRQSRLRLLTAWQPLTATPRGAPGAREVPPWPDRIIEEARATVESAEPGVAVEVRLVREPPLEALVEAAEQADLLALGSRGLGPAARFTLGGTGLDLVPRVAVPVVLVRARHDRPATEEGSSVAVGVSLHAACEGLLAFAFETAARRAVPLRAVHGRNLPPFAYDRGGAVERAAADQAEVLAREELSQALRPWREKFRDVRVEEQVVMESPAPALLHGAAGAQLLIVGRRHLGHAVPRIGHVVHAAVHHAPCPVAIVPHE
ncbi:universal stress protein [Streptomyces sp. 769]|uniref:universal stress protein n=1 Tax=Streptomyces sp. 769 TaxID=1262452 RepID=UPI00057CB2DE|nr:universal stress protein [Streptomyces sp. 769]AJC52973.1 stress-inducible protein [Streptomyces sp. 769]